jgi:hypothetical protein
MALFLAAIILAFVGDWSSGLNRGEPSTEPNMPRVIGWVPEGVELRQTECGFCFVRPAE